MHPNAQRPALPLSKEMMQRLLESIDNDNTQDLHDAVCLITELGFSPCLLEETRWSDLVLAFDKVVITTSNRKLVLPASAAVLQLLEERRRRSNGEGPLFAIPLRTLDQQLEQHCLNHGFGLITLSTMSLMFNQTLLAKLRSGKFVDFLLLARIG